MKQMNGYVKNLTSLWIHIMKRAVAPGAKISLQELYEQYGKKHDLPPNIEFVKWLEDIKLRDKNKWKIVFIDEPQEDSLVQNNESSVVVDEKVNTEVKKDVQNKSDIVTPLVIKNFEVSDIVGLTVRKARELLSHIFDIQLLKYSEKEASQLANKDSLCILIRKRIQELEISNRR